MKPVYQTKFGNKEGNCLAACIASIFELRLEEVPNFIEGDTGNGEWHQKLWDFLHSLEHDHVFYYIADPYKVPTFPKGRYHIIGGISPRGLLHAVVGFNGKIVHDPHPEGGGLLTIADYMIIHKKDEDPWELCK